MAYRGGGGGGRGGGEQQHPAYGGRGVPMGGRGGGRAPTGFVWPPPGASTPRPATVVYHNPAATEPQVATYQHGVVYRTPAPAPVTIRAPSPTPAAVRAPSPAAPPFQPARVSAPAPPTPTPSTASIAKELEQKLFVTETALAPPAAAAAAAVEAGQAADEKAPEVDLAPVSKKGLAHPARPGAGTVGRKVMIRANHFLVNVADNNLFHYDVRLAEPIPLPPPTYVLSVCSACMCALLALLLPDLPLRALSRTIFVVVCAFGSVGCNSCLGFPR